MKCKFCGYEFEESQCNDSCKHCKLNCGKIRCPNCGYEEIPEPESLVKIKEIFNKILKK